MTARLGDVLADLGAGLEITARRLDSFQAAVVRLARGAGPNPDARTIEDLQEIDAIVQRLSRLVGLTHDLSVAAGDGDVSVTDAARTALKGLAQDTHRASSDCDFF